MKIKMYLNIFYDRDFIVDASCLDFPSLLREAGIGISIFQYRPKYFDDVTEKTYERGLSYYVIRLH